jgi:hypothetical protein
MSTYPCARCITAGDKASKQVRQRRRDTHAPPPGLPLHCCRLPAMTHSLSLCNRHRCRPRRRAAAAKLRSQRHHPHPSSALARFSGPISCHPPAPNPFHRLLYSRGNNALTAMPATYSQIQLHTQAFQLTASVAHLVGRPNRRQPTGRSGRSCTHANPSAAGCSFPTLQVAAFLNQAGYVAIDSLKVVTPPGSSSPASKLRQAAAD